MAKRFSDLEERLNNALRAGSTMQSLAADTNKDIKLRNYVKWLLFEDPSKHKRDAASKRNTGGLETVNLNPFKIDLGSNIFVQTTVSKRSSESTNALPAAIRDKCNWKPLAVNQFAVPGKGWFEPAQVYIREQAQNVITVSASSNKITGTEYTTRSGSGQQGFVLPFGATNETQTEIEARQVILGELTSITSPYSISFKDEDANATPAKGATTGP